MLIGSIFDDGLTGIDFTVRGLEVCIEMREVYGEVQCKLTVSRDTSSVQTSVQPMEVGDRGKHDKSMIEHGETCQHREHIASD